jgi:hypothetical protein
MPHKIQTKPHPSYLGNISQFEHSITASHLGPTNAHALRQPGCRLGIMLPHHAIQPDLLALFDLAEAVLAHALRILCVLPAGMVAGNIDPRV